MSHAINCIKYRNTFCSVQQRDVSSYLRRFEPSKGGLGATYDVHLRLIGKRVVDFLLVLIELFLLGVTSKALRANSKSAISLQRGPVDPKFQVGARGHSHQSLFSEN